METGTGKTFCFLECVYALHQNYRLSKFIVLVPSNAIKLGVLKSIEITRDFFKSEYSTHLESYEDIERFILASNHKCCVLVMTFSAFNKEGNIINKSCLENTNLFNGAKSYMQALASMRPVVIMDEPHRFLGDKTKKYLEQLNALITLRFGATFKDDYKNVIFNLNLIYKMITLLLYQKSTKLILKNALFSIKAHIFFSIFPLSFLFFLKALITT